MAYFSVIEEKYSLASRLSDTSPTVKALLRQFNVGMEKIARSKKQDITARTHIRGLSYFITPKRAFIFLNIRKDFFSLVYYSGKADIPGLLKANWIQGKDNSGSETFRVGDDQSLSEALKFAEFSFSITQLEFVKPPEQVLLEKASARLQRFNKHCLHYNLVAEGAYRKLETVDSPFNLEYRPYIIAALISFDMARMMGNGLEQKYDVKCDGFASKLNSKLENIRSDIEPLVLLPFQNFKIESAKQAIKKGYNAFSKGGNIGLHSNGKAFHVGATKILHFINPSLFPIIDSNAAKTLRALFEMPFKKGTQPGYSADLYVRSMNVIHRTISEYGADRFQALEPDTPLMRIFDKLTFAWGNNW